MSKAGTTLAAKAKVERERQALVAKHRAIIDAADKVKFAEFEREAKENTASVKRAVAERTARETARDLARSEREATRAQREASEGDEPKAPRVKGERRKSNAHAAYTFGRKIEDDDEFSATMAKYLRKDKTLTWAGVLVEMRKDGIAGGTKRAARLFGAAQSQAIGSAVGKVEPTAEEKGPTALKRSLGNAPSKGKVGLAAAAKSFNAGAAKARADYEKGRLSATYARKPKTTVKATAPKIAKRKR